MANKIILKKSSVAAKTPLATDLEVGELAVNLADQKLYTKNTGGAVIVVGSNSAAAVESVAGKTGVVTLTKSDVGLANVDDTSDLNKPVSTAQQTALNLKANLASPTFTGTPAAPTAAADTNTTQVATTAYVIGQGYLKTTTAASTYQPIDADLTAIAALAGTTGLLRKTAANTWSLDTASYLTANQTVTLSGDASGSGSTAIAVTLANSGVTAGTYTKLTVDAKGRATVGATLASTDIPSLDASKITTGVFDAARLPSYVDDVLEYANLAGFPVTGETGKIYVAIDTNKTYRWSGSAYVYITSGAVDSVGGFTGVVTATNLLDAIKTVDGTTSGLDADLLDGNHASAFYLATNPSGYITSSSSITGNAATASSSPLLSALAPYVWSVSTLPTSYANGIQTSFVDPTGWPSYGGVTTISPYTGGGGALQMYVPYSPTYGGTGMQVRFGNYDVSSGNSWTAWKTLLASDNYNNYSPTLTGGGASGSWGISVTGSSASCTGNAATASDSSLLNGISAVKLFNNMGQAHGTSASFDAQGTALTRDFGYRYVQGSGNAPGFGNLGVNQYYSWNIGLGSDYAYSSYGMQFAIPRNATTPYLSVRYEEGGALGAWQKLSAGYADTAGSATSATTAGSCTGNAATSSNTSSISNAVGGSYTWTGIQYYASNRNTTSDSPPLQAYSNNGSGAIMSFHRGGYYAVNMGLDSDNVFRIGGWSAAANRWQLDMSGNGTYAGNVTAYSDERLKKNWRPVQDNFVSKLAKVKSGIYDRTDEEITQAGVSAQAWQKVLPETVIEDASGTLSVNYGAAAMVSCVELAKVIEELRAEIAEMKASLGK